VEGLNEREQSVLNAVIARHVSTAEPVSSQELCDYFGLRWSSATIRNVLSGLEEKGFLNHPYTSAGKIPTVKAYKQMVESLLGSQTELNEEEQLRISQILGEVRETDKLIRLTAKVLAITSRLLAVTWLPMQQVDKLDRVYFIRLSGCKLMLIARTLSGQEFQQIVELEEKFDLRLIGQAIALVNQWGHGQTPEGLEQLTQANCPGLDRRMAFLVKQALVWIKRSLQNPMSETVVIEGAVNLINQPEFNDIHATRELVSLLDERGRLLQSLQNPGIRCQGVRVLIGEGQWAKNFPALSCVLEEIALPDKRRIQMGVIGPSRMPYARIIPLVQEVAMAFSNAIEV
jgi:heat-inducible transcriptional repressor